MKKFLQVKITKCPKCNKTAQGVFRGTMSRRRNIVDLSGPIAVDCDKCGYHNKIKK